MRSIALAICLGGVLAAGCSARDAGEPSTESPSPHRDGELLGEFALELSADGVVAIGTRAIAVPGNPVLVPAGTGAGKVLMTNVGVSFDPMVCGGPNRICVSYQLTNNTGGNLEQLTAVLDGVTPMSSAAVDDDALPFYLTQNPKYLDTWGVWQYGNVAPGNSFTRTWSFPYSGQPVKVRGLLFGFKALPETACTDTFDNDFDGTADCADSDCSAAPACQAPEAPASCAAWLDQGATMDGDYTINVDGTDMTASCDMTTDGGGWTLILNYVHATGTNPNLNARTSDLPLMTARTLGNDQQGGASWGHAAPALLAGIDHAEMRFSCATSNHARVMHFKTTSANCLGYFSSGLGQCDNLSGNHTPLAGHNAQLPGTQFHWFSNQGLFALTEFPFFLLHSGTWGIKGFGTYWTCDDYVDSLPSTIHSVWVR